MNKTRLIPIIIVIFLLSGCSKSIAVDTTKINAAKQVQVSTEKPAAEATEASSKNLDTIKAEKSYFGQYVIKKLLAYGPVGTYTSEEINVIIGKKLSFSKDKASCFGEEADLLNETAENPTYENKDILKADFESENKITFEKLGLNGGSVTQVTAEDSKGNGCLFYIKDDNTLILYGGGIYLELAREK